MHYVGYCTSMHCELISDRSIYNMVAVNVYIDVKFALANE
jgi:hypothetical protein